VLVDRKKLHRELMDTLAKFATVVEEIFPIKEVGKHAQHLD
jgi:hypothetical protein